MKLLAASDLHGYRDVYEWLVQVCRVKRPDILVLAGDLLGCPDGPGTVEDTQRHEAAEIVRILEGAHVPICYIMGNDDLVELDPPSSQFIPIHGRRVELGGVSFVGYQYSLPFMGGTHEKPDDEIRADLFRMTDLVDRETILVTHSPALGVLDKGMLDIHAGSRAILDFARDREVRAHIHGHIHGQFGRLDRHFNVASGGRRRAMLIDVTSMQATVEREP